MDIKELNVNNRNKTAQNHPWEYARAKVVMDILKKHSTKTSQSKYILDVGCGDIFFLNQYCAHDKWLGHYRRYNQKMLREHTKNAGLKYLSGGYFFSTLLFPRLIQKWMESLSRKEKEVTGIGGWNGGRLISKLYESFLLADYYFFKPFKSIGINVPGLSTYAICKRLS